MVEEEDDYDLAAQQHLRAESTIPTARLPCLNPMYEAVRHEMLVHLLNSNAEFDMKTTAAAVDTLLDPSGVVTALETARGTGKQLLAAAGAAVTTTAISYEERVTAAVTAAAEALVTTAAMSPQNRPEGFVPPKHRRRSKGMVIVNQCAPWAATGLRRRSSSKALITWNKASAAGDTEDEAANCQEVESGLGDLYKSEVRLSAPSSSSFSLPLTESSTAWLAQIVCKNSLWRDGDFADQEREWRRVSHDECGE